ncbi:MAG: tRNA (N(6)-L-threonylcarbamoyladenosine(37)-C(2))-methylthiotransferase MtaB, partial [Spirochaetia bacterium]
MRAAFFTLGCKLNQSESEALASSFASRGFFIVPPTDTADIYIFNTCTVTGMAEQKARRMIRKAARENPEAVVLVTGCYAQLEGGEAGELAKNVVVVGQHEKDMLLDLPRFLERRCAEESANFQDADGAVLKGGEGGTFSAEEVRNCIHRLREGRLEPHGGGGEEKLSPFRYDADTYSFHSRAFLKIQDGCDRSCAYCRVPLARGASVSLDTKTVLERALHIEESGYREVVLTGVNITSYRDASAGLPELIELL